MEVPDTSSDVLARLAEARLSDVVRRANLRFMLFLLMVASLMSKSDCELDGFGWRASDSLLANGKESSVSRI